MSRQRYFYRLGRRREKPAEQPAASCLFRLDPSGAAPRCCVPRTPCLAAVLAHKLVGSKIAFPGPGWGFAKVLGGKSELSVLGSPIPPRKDLSPLTWLHHPQHTPAESSLKRSWQLEVISAVWDAGRTQDLEGPGRAELLHGE